MCNKFTELVIELRVSLEETSCVIDILLPDT